jgi:O-antigen/teichoic acid export membrane protein
MNIKSLINREGNTIQAMWVAMGSLSSFALAIVSAAILSRYFNKTDYGTYRQILYVYSTLLLVFTAGLPTVFSYFLPRYSLQQGKEIVWKITKVLFLLGALFSIFLFVFSGVIADLLKNPELRYGLKVFSPIPMLLLPTLGIEGIFSTYKKTFYIAVFNTLSRLLMLLFIVLPVIIFNGSYIYAIYGWLVVSFLSLIIAVLFKRIPFRGVKAEKSNLSYKQVFAYSLPLVTASLWGIAIRSSDQFFISRFFGTEIFAEFSNGFIDIPFVGMVTGATSTVLLPLFSKIVHNQQAKSHIEEILTLWRNALTKSALIIYPIVVFFTFNAKETVVILFSNTYLNSAIYFQIAMVLNFFNIIVFAPLLFSMGETKFYSNLHMYFAFIAWGLGYLVVIVFNSPVALAVFSVLMAILRALISLKHVSSLLKVSFVAMFPIKDFSILIFHSTITIVVVKTLVNLMHFQLNDFANIILIFVGFTSILLVTARFFNLDYLSVIKPIFQKVSK